MKALIKRKEESGAEIIEVETPQPGLSEVLVKVKATSICGTDVHIYEWNEWARQRIKPPLVMGHEMAGEVVEIGEGVTSVKVGDYISAETHIYCGRCFQCRTGQTHICQNLKILGLDRDGVFAEYALIPENVVWKNDPSIPPKLASIQEPLGNSVHALGNVAGCSVAIFGAGTTGLFATALAYIEGATSIYVIDQYEFRLDLAKTLGATSTINFRNVDVVSFILKATNGLGVDVALEMSGSPLALSQALKIARSGGRVVAFGIPSRPVKIDLSDVIFKEIKIGGITGRKIFETWYKTSSFLISGKLDISAVITHELPLDEFERGFDLLMNHPDRAVKVVLYP